MKNGGYKIIDLNNYPHSNGVGVVHVGIYEAIEGTRKPILLSGLNVDGIEFHDVFVIPTVDGSSYFFNITQTSTYNVSAVVEDTDVVTINLVSY